MDQKEVIILGVARSGTSLTSKILDTMGIPMNIHEDKAQQKSNERVEKVAGYATYECRAMTMLTIQLRKGSGDIEKCLKIRRDAAAGNDWGFKSALTHHVFEELLPHLRNPHFIVVIRNMYTNTMSYARWDGLLQSNREKAATEKHILEADRKRFNRIFSLVNDDFSQLVRIVTKYNEQYPFYLFSYERLLNSPKVVLDDLASFLGRELGDSEKEILSFIEPRRG